MAHVATLTIDHTKVAGDLTDYVVAVINNSDAGWAELYALATEGGGDIRAFKDDDTTELPREIVSFSVSSETGEIYIKYSGTTSSSVDTDIHIYADGTSSDYAVTATYGRNNVWTDYKLVMHMTDASDSTGNYTSITANGGVTAGGIAGHFGDATSFDGANDLYDINAQVVNTATASYSVQAWLNPDVINTNNYAVGQSRFGLGVNVFVASNYVGFWYNGSWSTAATAATVGVWAKIDTIYDRGNSVVKLVKDGSVTTGGAASANLQLLSEHTGVGGRVGVTNLWDGGIDEVRISEQALSDNWTLTEYNNQNSSSTFYSVAAIGGAVEETLTATAQATATLVKEMQKEMQVTAQATASFTKEIGKTISATAQATTSVLRSLGKVLSVTAQATVSLMTKQVTLKELVATAQATASLVKESVNAVSLTVTASASVTVTSLKELVRTLAATAQASASLVQSGLIISRELLVTARATVTMARGLTLTKILTATASSVVLLAKDFGFLDKYPENEATYEDKYPET